MRHFFRIIEDGNDFKLFSPLHLLLLLIFFIGIIAIRFRWFKLGDKKINKTLSYTLISIILIDQIILYAWQIGSGYFNLAISLPLYHCRVAVWCLIIGKFMKNRFISTIGIYWGTMGALVAMIMVDLYDFQFPHYTNFQFFICHILMGWFIINQLFNEGILINSKDQKKVLLATNIYNILLTGINLLLIKLGYPTNYGYMIEMPPFAPSLGPWYVQALFMIAVFNVGMWLLYGLFRLIQDREDIKVKHVYK